MSSRCTLGKLTSPFSVLIDGTAIAVTIAIRPATVITSNSVVPRSHRSRNIGRCQRRFWYVRTCSGMIAAAYLLKLFESYTCVELPPPLSLYVGTPT